MQHKSARWWLGPDQLPLRWNAILGSLVLGAGAFCVYEWLGQHTPAGDMLAPPPGEYPGGSRIYPRYMVRFESDTLDVVEIWPFSSSLAPDVADICRATGYWLTEVKNSLSLAEARLSEESEPAAQRQIKEALAQRETYYQAVYHAWVELGCGDSQEVENA